LGGAVPAGAELSPHSRLRIDEARRALSGTHDALVYVLSGAGLSATAGLRTYRGPEGLYTTGTLPPLHVTNAVPARVHVVWEHLHGIAATAAAAESRPPSPAYQALASFERRLTGSATTDSPGRRHLVVGTQNIDGLHQHAGLRHVLELHGSVRRAICLDEGCSAVAATVDLEHDRAAVPRCSDCGGRTRPDVVLFGEDPYRMEQAMSAAVAADVVLAVGTSLQVWPAAATVAQATGHDVPGLWLDAEPDRAWQDLPAPARPYFQPLARVPGDLNATLPAVLDALLG
jgi:NAD-dependent deacetylase